mgnify:CR=1 FL=1
MFWVTATVCKLRAISTFKYSNFDSIDALEAKLPEDVLVLPAPDRAVVGVQTIGVGHVKVKLDRRKALGDDARVDAGRRGLLTVELPVTQWLEAARMLRDHEDLAFEQLTDLCGVDYLGFGQAEWETHDATSGGFSRGVEALGFPDVPFRKSPRYAYAPPSPNVESR